jgi:hypothetical protein
VPSTPPDRFGVPAVSKALTGAVADVLLRNEVRTEASADARAEVIAALAQDAPDRATPRVREPDPIVVHVEPPEPDTGVLPTTSHVLRGPASWYCRAGVSPCTATHPDLGGFDAYAAAGPKLRAAIGPGWRGTIVSVDGIRVRLIDWCQCYQGEPHEKLLDLYYDVYARTGGSVTIRW